MHTPPIRIHRPCEGVAVVMLDRPHRLNAMRPSTIGPLVEAFEVLANDESTRAVVLTGAGRGFCTGMDLGALEEMAPIDVESQTAWMRDLMRASILLDWLPQPTIAAVNGPATGGGFGYAMGCDIRIASRSALFSATFARMAMGPDAGLSHSLPRAAGYARALELLLTADVVDADEALRLGIVSRVVEDAQETAIELAKRIAAVPGHASRSIKRTLRQSLATDFEAAVDTEARAQAELICHPDWMANATAWLAKHGGR
ncbi:enoyl-CoA hydratase/isomerase family protein [Amycolatopsis anabasis]|uniref:enoyl-CoA hydratase/isomerase family protein n=1 Tax=Amycolatopsis anabasis TaxID=1840409 RepID=UPI00131CF12D|nr:enoyl-CoA hydratase/isomerase family protein [Amycolatopsis anabasis]